MSVTSDFPTSVSAMLSLRRAKQAIEFYKRAFGAVETTRLEAPDGSVVAEMEIDGSKFLLADESPEHGNFSPETIGGCSTRISLLTANPDAVFARAVTAGATPIFPVADKPWGHRQGRIVDPFGHHWLIGRPLNNNK
jgi:PhnB protein